MSKGKFALGAIIGAAAGLVAGVLTAPKAGKETRADIKAKAGELKADADKKLTDAKKSGEKTVNDGRHMAEDYADRTKRALNSAKREFVTDDTKKK
ncbi:MAG TPA: YtxH domain-containing protein [Patescibacteria group bacterium]|jgi:gas vesicle protein|nr:YtxH domain-containing protein [Patescibacteria group bacterium]